jgi:hypothetical protein
METKEIPLIGTGLHSYIDPIFWYLPFSNVKQAYATLDAMEGVTESDWETKRAEIAAELTLERAQQDLSDGWKAWLKENGPGKGRGLKERRGIPAHANYSLVCTHISVIDLSAICVGDTVPSESHFRAHMMRIYKYNNTTCVIT